MASSKVSGFLKRNKGGEEDDQQPLNYGEKKDCFTIGAAINYSLVIDFVAIILSCLIIIGSLGTLRKDVSNLPPAAPNDTSSFSCYMYATYVGGEGQPCTLNLDSARPCDGAMVGFSFVAVMAVAFVVALLVKAILRHDLNWTLYIEVPILVVSILLVFALAVTISIGNVTTCEAVKKYHKCLGEFEGCNGTFPHGDFKHNIRASVAQNTAWFVFLFLFVAIILFAIRLAVFLKRRRKQAIQRTLANEEDFNEDEGGPKPV